MSLDVLSRDPHALESNPGASSGHFKSAQEEMMQRQREEYEKRGIALTFFDQATTTLPYLINLDVDAYRSHRFMFILSKEVWIYIYIDI
jgi:hypothetical protein